MIKSELSIMLQGKVEVTGHPGREDGSFEVDIQGPQHCTKSALLRAIWPGPGTIYGESKRGSVIFLNLHAVQLQGSSCFKTRLRACNELLEFLVNCVLTIRENKLNCEISLSFQNLKLSLIRPRPQHNTKLNKLPTVSL